MDKISEEKLFQNNTKEDIKYWCRNLQYFHYMRARGGHNCEGDSFSAYFKYDGLEDLKNKLSKLDVTLNKLSEGQISFDPFASYSIDDLDKIRITIPDFNDFEQPQYVEIYEHKAHIWVMPGRFEISISGTKDDQIYKVSGDDFYVCRLLEAQFDNLEWKSILDEEIKAQSHCISKEKYPELF